MMLVMMRMINIIRRMIVLMMRGRGRGRVLKPPSCIRWRPCWGFWRCFRASKWIFFSSLDSKCWICRSCLHLPECPSSSSSSFNQLSLLFVPGALAPGEGGGRWSLPEMLKWNHKINASYSQKKEKKKMEMSFHGWPRGTTRNNVLETKMEPTHPTLSAWHSLHLLLQIQ